MKEFKKSAKHTIRKNDFGHRDLGTKSACSKEKRKTLFVSFSFDI